LFFVQLRIAPQNPKTPQSNCKINFVGKIMKEHYDVSGVKERSY